jgi:lycopene beta-cyclase
MDELDVAVLGAGPAGSLIAAALARESLRVALVAPDPTARWSNVYATWLDELQACGRESWTLATWRRPVVRLGDDRAVELGCSYARIDAARMQDDLRRELLAAGGEPIAARAMSVEHRRAASTVALDVGRRLDARVVIDATGAGSPFVARRGGSPAFQSAYGELLRLRSRARETDEMAFMDWRGDADPPSFLYAMPLGDDLYFAEETSLVHRPALGHGALRARLHARLARMGVRGAEVVGREVCLIPMGVGLPRRQRTVGYGAAGAFIHPATGYQIARALRLAQPTARVIASALRERDAVAAARAAHRILWPASAQVAWRLYAEGAEALATFDAKTMRGFMAAFFSLPQARWRGFLDGTLTPAAILAAMARVFFAADAPLRRRLVSSASAGALMARGAS